VLATFLAGTVQAKKPVVAVFEIKNSAKVSNEDLQKLHGLIGTELAATGQFSVVPNSDVKRALQEKKAESYKDCYDESCQIEIGKELAAEMTLATSVEKLGRDCIVSMQLYNLRTGASDRGANEKATCRVADLYDALVKAIHRISNSEDEAKTASGSNPGTQVSSSQVTPAPTQSNSEPTWVPSRVATDFRNKSQKQKKDRNWTAKRLKELESADDRARNEDKKQANDYKRSAIDAIRKKRLIRAEIELGFCLELIPKHRDCNKLMGIVREKKGDRKGAVKYYRRYLSVTPKAPDRAFIEKKIRKIENGKRYR